uniref:Protein kinase domain-containing protein n=1 Tax=Oryza nivara TaxID=4536 RepID=A0A0E0I958_ORYNI
MLSIVHCDIKPSNILLDDDMVTQATDFGLAKIMNIAEPCKESSSFVTKGTIRYVATEYGSGSPESPRERMKMNNVVKELIDTKKAFSAHTYA